MVDLTFSPSKPRNRKHFSDILTSNPSSRQYDLTTLSKEKISHDQWQKELSQSNNSEAEDGDLGLRELNEEATLELTKSSELSPPTTAVSRLESPRIPPRPDTPIPADTKIEEVNNLTSHIRSAATMLAQLNSKNLPRADAQPTGTGILAQMSSLKDHRLAMSTVTEDTSTSIERTMLQKA